MLVSIDVTKLAGGEKHIFSGLAAPSSQGGGAPATTKKYGPPHAHTQCEKQQKHLRVDQTIPSGSDLDNSRQEPEAITATG